MKTITISTLAASLMLLTACGGGSDTAASDPSSTYATALDYQDPVSTGFRLVKNTSASSKTRLVLNLVGPSGTQGKGVAFFMGADSAKVSWVHPTGATGSHFAAGSVFSLGSSPQFLTDKVDGGQLQIALFQKGGTAVTLGSSPILSTGLTLKSQVAKGAVSLAPVSGKEAVLLDANGTLTPITIQVGTLTAQ